MSVDDQKPADIAIDPKLAETIKNLSVERQLNLLKQLLEGDITEALFGLVHLPVFRSRGIIAALVLRQHGDTGWQACQLIRRFNSSATPKSSFSRPRRMSSEYVIITSA